MKRVYYGAPAEEDSGEEVEDVPAILPVPTPWPMLPGINAVTVDRTTGKLASNWCDEADQYLEYYLPGTEPTEFCDRSGGRRFRMPRIR